MEPNELEGNGFGEFLLDATVEGTAVAICTRMILMASCQLTAVKYGTWTAFILYFRILFHSK
jgi:hypothetical protein